MLKECGLTNRTVAVDIGACDPFEPESLCLRTDLGHGGRFERTVSVLIGPHCPP